MYGTEKNWTSIHLQKRSQHNSSASIDGFPSGSIRTFCLKGPDIGQLHHLNVNVNETSIVCFLLFCNQFLFLFSLLVLV